MKLIFSLLLLLPSISSAQWTIGSRSFSHPSGPATFTKNGAGCTNGALGASSVACTTSQSAGDLIVISVADHDGFLTTVINGTDTSTQLWYAPDSANPAYAGMYYILATAASGSVTYTLNASAGDGFLSIAVQPYTPSSGSATLDSTFSSSFFQASTSGSVANANCGTARTPGNNNELVVSLDVPDNVAPTVGANYTFSNTANNVFTQYWIQTTKTSTNGAFVSAADDWVAGCAAFIP